VRAITVLLALGCALTAGDARAQGAAPAPTPPPDEAAKAADGGSLMTTEALGSGNVGMAMGGGVAVLFPLYRIEAGVGLNDWLDVAGRFETVIGILHFPGVGLRAMPFRFGKWRAGARLDVNYFLFGLKSDRLNLTSTLYFTPEIGISGPVSAGSELSFGLGAEIDMFHVEVVDDESEVVGDVHYDATMLRTVFLTELTDEVDGFAQLRMRVPTDTFSFEGEDLVVMPLLDIGATWTF
jgi:hypothetical protein